MYKSIIKGQNATKSIVWNAWSPYQNNPWAKKKKISLRKISTGIFGYFGVTCFRFI